MFQTEAEPSKSPHFGQNVRSIFKIFNKNTDDLKLLLEKTPELDDIISEFTSKESNQYTSLQKSIEMMKLASKERRFTLTPLIAKYNVEYDDEHQLHKLLTEEKEIDHVFVNPISGLEDFYYHYILYIPIPIDILKIEEPKMLLKEHWNIILDGTPKKFRTKIIKEFEPLYIIGRVYGWDGAWLAYSVTVIDNQKFWSLPLVKSPYNGTQPFLGVKKGEFAILQNDETEISRRKAKYAYNKIEQRAEKIDSIEFEHGKSIEVDPEWIITHNVYSDQFEEYDLKNSSRDFGAKLGTASIEEGFSNSKDVLEFMKKEIMGKPLYEFSQDEIRRYRIHNKL